VRTSQARPHGLRSWRDHPVAPLVRRASLAPCTA